MTVMGPVLFRAVLLPVLYAAIKITAGILVLYFGKRYAKKYQEEHS